MRVLDGVLVLASGAIPLVYALVIRRRRRAAPYVARWGAAAAAGLGLVVLLELGLASAESARYRVSLLGLRFYPEDVSGSPQPADVLVGGDYDEVDVYVPEAGAIPTARLSLAPGDSVVRIDGFEDGTSLLLHRRDREEWRILGARAFQPSDTLVVRGVGRERRIVPDGEGTLRDLATGTAVQIPPPAIEGPLVRLRALFGLSGRPSVWQRTYPLADVLAQIDSLEMGSHQGLTSFFYYRREGGQLSRDFQLMVADLDSEVEVTGRTQGVPAAVPDGSRILVAGLPFRDYRELDLESRIERYGIRPLASFELLAHPDRLDVIPSRTEVRVIRLGEWDRGSLQAPTLTVRIAHAENVAARDAIVFDTPSAGFAALSEAQLELSRDPSDRAFGIETPQGQGTWAIGEPFPLGQGLGRALLIRIDGQRVTLTLVALLTVLYVLAALGFLVRPFAAPIFPLALAGLGLASIRLLLSYAIHLNDPFAQEPYQLSLWLVPIVPWTILGLWEAGCRWSAARSESDWFDGGGRNDRDVTRRAGRTRWAYGLFGLSGSVIALGVFEPGLRIVVGIGLAFLPLLTVLSADAFVSDSVGGVKAWFSRLVDGTRRLRFPGLAFGIALLVVRLMLAMLGMREALLDQPRIGLGIIYTPLAILGFAWVAVAHDRTLRGGRRKGELGWAVICALIDIAGYLTLAFLGTAVVVSDFGIALVGLPGLLLFLYLYGAGWVRSAGRYVLACCAAPLVLFVAIQASPALLSGVWETGEIEEDIRMRAWKRNDLLLLERADFETLRYIGQRKSEALAVMRETMHAYTRGPLFGRGFLETEVSDEVRDTVAREHAVGALVAGQWGMAGTLSILLLLGAHLLVAFLAPYALQGRAGLHAALSIGGSELLAFTVLPIAGLWLVGLLPGWLPTAVLGLALTAGSVAVVAIAWRARDEEASVVVTELSRPRMRFPETVVVVTLLLVVFAGVYMILANYGLALFTGKNLYLLGLDSMGDALEYLGLAGLAALAFGASGAPLAAGETASSGRLPDARRVVSLPRSPEHRQ